MQTIRRGSYGTRIEGILGTAVTMKDLRDDHGAGLTDAKVDYLRAH